MALLGISPVFQALIAVVAWILSALVINEGLAKIGADRDHHKIGLGLAVSLATGSVLILLVSAVRGLSPVFSVDSVLMGLFTFPLGTGLYYVASELYGQNAEIASQFIKVKPVFSVIIGVMLGEALGELTMASFALIVLGALLLIAGTFRGEFHPVAAVIGLLSALSWSVGEMFAKLGTIATASFTATAGALVSGTLVYLAVGAPILARRVSRQELRKPWIRWFAAHGILSFGIAYTFFFAAIKQMGMSRTALVTAFWPVIAILAGYGVARMRGRHAEKAEHIRYFIPAAILLVTGSLLVVAGSLLAIL